MQSSELPVHMIDIDSLTDELSGQLLFTHDQRQVIAAFLGLSSFDKFHMDYNIAPIANERFSVTGRLVAELSQPCVVTLEPVSETIDEAIETELWPEAQLKDNEALTSEDGIAEQAMLDDPPIPIIAGKVDLAAYAIEILSTAMTAYPRKENAEFDWQDPASGPDGQKLSPFAELEKLKAKS